MNALVNGSEKVTSKKKHITNNFPAKVMFAHICGISRRNVCLRIISLITSFSCLMVLLINTHRNYDVEEMMQHLNKHKTDYCIQMGIDECFRRNPERGSYYDYPFEFIVNPIQTCMKNGYPADVYVLYLIKTGVENKDFRSTIRETWGNDTTLHKYKIRKLFLLGTSNTNPNATLDLLEESKKHNDMIIASFHDEYRYILSMKSSLAIEWAHTYCAHAKYHLLIDDNIYLSNRNLVEFLSAEETFNPCLHYSNQYLDNGKNCMFVLYAGFKLSREPPMRDKRSKFFASFQEMPVDMYPPFAVGFAMLLDKAALGIFHTALNVTKIAFVDDVYLGYLAIVMGYGDLPFHIPQFNRRHANLNEPSAVQKDIINHEMNPSQIRDHFDAETSLYTESTKSY